MAVPPPLARVRHGPKSLTATLHSGYEGHSICARKGVDPMFEVRIHGRRGQGVLATAELLAIAASMEGRRAQASSEVDAGDAAAEVAAWCRIGDPEPGEHRPHALVVQDAALLEHLADELPDDGYLLVNSGLRIDNLGLSPLALRPERTITVPATEIAVKLTGHRRPGPALAGAFAALTGVVSLDSVLAAIRQRFGGEAGRMSAAAAMATFGIVRTEIGDVSAMRPH